MLTRTVYPRSWLSSISSYLFCPESIQLLGVFSLITWAYQRTGANFLSSGALLTSTLERHTHVWLPTLTSFTVSSLGLFFSRAHQIREGEQNKQLQIEDTLYLDMKTHMEEGDKALQSGMYASAREHYLACYKLFDQFFSQDGRQRAKQLTLLSINKVALTSIQLKDYSLALDWLTKAIQNKGKWGDLQGYAGLLNLRALIYYKKSALFLIQYEEAKKENKEQHYNMLAKKDLQASYALDPTQNEVFLFLRYLSPEGEAYLAQHIPNELFKPIVLLTANPSGLREEMLTICAKACIQTKKWDYAFCLLKEKLASMEVNSQTFYEIAQLNLFYIEVCQGIIQTGAPIKQLKPEIIETTNGEPQEVILEQKTIELSSFKTKLTQLAEQTDDLLESLIFILNNDSRVNEESLRKKLEYGFFYLNLAGRLEDDKFKTKASTLFQEVSTASLETGELANIASEQLASMSSPLRLG